MSTKQGKARGKKIAPDAQKDIEGTPIEDSGAQLLFRANLGSATTARQGLPLGEKARMMR